MPIHEINIYGQNYEDKSSQGSLKLPPIGKNYGYNLGTTNNIYKKDKIKMARTIAKGEMQLEDDNNFHGGSSQLDQVQEYSISHSPG